MLFSFQYTASGPADNVGFLTSDLAVCVSETLGDGAIIAIGAFLKNPHLHYASLFTYFFPTCIVSSFGIHHSCNTLFLHKTMSPPPQSLYIFLSSSQYCDGYQQGSKNTCHQNSNVFLYNTVHIQGDV